MYAYFGDFGVSPNQHLKKSLLLLHSLVAPVIILVASTGTATSCFFVYVEQLSHWAYRDRILKHRSDKGYVHALWGRAFYFELQDLETMRPKWLWVSTSVS